MVFVAVRHEHRAQLMLPFADVRKVVDNDIDAEHFVVGKHQAAVDDHHVVVGLDDRHIAADLAAAAQRNNARIGRVGGRWYAQYIRVQKLVLLLTVRGVNDELPCPPGGVE